MKGKIIYRIPPWTFDKKWSVLEWLEIDKRNVLLLTTMNLTVTVGQDTVV